jgi:hypothetical protein
MLIQLEEWKDILADCIKPGGKLNVASCQQLADLTVPI